MPYLQRTSPGYSSVREVSGVPKSYGHDVVGDVHFIRQL
jgi:hypothetical protein